MRWVAQNTSDESRFLVVTGVLWQIDATSEWFPAIAQRHSVATVQGYERTTPASWRTRVARHEQLRQMCSDTATCLSPCLHDADYIYIPKGPRLGPLSASDCCPALRRTLTDAPAPSCTTDLEPRSPG
jgi:hypothetical protein